MALVCRVTGPHRVQAATAQPSCLRWALTRASVGAALSLGSQQPCSELRSSLCSQQISAFFPVRLCCHMALAVLLSASHSLALLLSNSAPSPKSKILTLREHGRDGSCYLGEEGIGSRQSPNLC